MNKGYVQLKEMSVERRAEWITKVNKATTWTWHEMVRSALQDEFNAVEDGQWTMDDGYFKKYLLGFRHYLK